VGLLENSLFESVGQEEVVKYCFFQQLINKYYYSMSECEFKVFGENGKS
jgi:hypothetical protein